MRAHRAECGNWVVLFSFGRTVEFFCGGRTELLESGDAILFNGGTKQVLSTSLAPSFLIV